MNRDAEQIKSMGNSAVPVDLHILNVFIAQ